MSQRVFAGCYVHLCTPSRRLLLLPHKKETPSCLRSPFVFLFLPTLPDSWWGVFRSYAIVLAIRPIELGRYRAQTKLFSNFWRNQAEQGVAKSGNHEPEQGEREAEGDSGV